MNADLETSLEALSASVAVVAAEHQEAQEAHHRANEAEAELLTRIVELAKPALRALSSRPRIVGGTRWHGVMTEDLKKFADWSGLRLSAGTAGPDEDFPEDRQGAYEGADLFLLPDGSWCRLVYSGTWSRWQGATSQWEAEVKTLTTEQVVAAYDVDDLVTRLVAAVDKAKGTRAGSTKAALARAEKFRSLATLLK